MKVYLIHFDRPLKHARHYIGKAKLLDARIAHHIDGSGARILQVCNQQGIEYHVVRIWELTAPEASQFERRLKRRKDSKKLCPICNPQRWERNEKAKSLI